MDFDSIGTSQCNVHGGRDADMVTSFLFTAFHAIGNLSVGLSDH